jgi:hypothetical protein
MAFEDFSVHAPRADVAARLYNLAESVNHDR